MGAAETIAPLRPRRGDVRAGRRQRSLERAPDQLRLEEGRFVAPDGRAASLGELARAAAPSGEPFSRLVEFEPSGAQNVTSFCAQVAEVEVDPETGRVEVKRLVTAHDVGTI